MSKNRSLIEIHIAVLLFGLAGLFGKWLPLSPFIIVLGRVFFACLSLGLMIIVSQQRLNASRQIDYFLFAGLGLLLVVHWVTFFKSIQVSSVAVGLLSYSSFPVFTAFLEPLFSREKPDKIIILFAVISLLGVFLVVPRFALENRTFQGILWGLLAGLTFSLLSIANRKLTLRYSSLIIAFYQDLFATLFLLPFFFALKPLIDVRGLCLLVILGTLCTAGAHTLFIKGMRKIQAQTASIISSLEPVYGIILAFILLGERPSLRTVAGGLVILGAAVAISFRALESGRAS
jgi:drug/metabolite transporter (DMT)-like permease